MGKKMERTYDLCEEDKEKMAEFIIKLYQGILYNSETLTSEINYQNDLKEINEKHNKYNRDVEIFIMQLQSKLEENKNIENLFKETFYNIFDSIIDKYMEEQ